FQAEDGIRDFHVTGVQTCALPIFSTPLLFHLLEFGGKVQDMHFMLQKEVVDRITALPNTKEYGRLSVMIQYFCKPTFLFEVPPGSFNPPPKVTSAVFRLEP